MSDFAPTQHPWWVAVTQVLNQRTVLRCSVCVLLFFLVSLTGRRAACSPPVVFAQSTAWYAETSWSLRCDSKAAAHRERWNPLQNHRTRNTSAVVGHVFGTLAYTDAIKQHIKCATFSTINLFKIEVRATDIVLTNGEGCMSPTNLPCISTNPMMKRKIQHRVSRVVDILKRSTPPNWTLLVMW